MCYFTLWTTLLYRIHVTARAGTCLTWCQPRGLTNVFTLVYGHNPVVGHFVVCQAASYAEEWLVYCRPDRKSYSRLKEFAGECHRWTTERIVPRCPKLPPCEGQGSQTQRVTKLVEHIEVQLHLPFSHPETCACLVEWNYMAGWVSLI